MAIYNNEEVTFSGIRQPILTVGGKLAVNKYVTDDDGNIVGKQPIINAIDIDWNNATTEGIGPIASTEDLIKILKEIKISVPDNIYDLQGANNLLTLQDVQALKPQLTGKSAYELAKEAYEETFHSDFPYQTAAAWVASLKGETGPRGFSGADGKNGKSAYEIAKSYYQSIGKEFPYTEEEWIQQVISGNDTKGYTDTEISKVVNTLSNSIKNSATTIEETNDDHLEVKLIETPKVNIGNNGEQITSYDVPYKYQILLKDIASKAELDTLKAKIDSMASSELIEQIEERINEIIGGASEAFDTLKEFEDWINNLPISPNEIVASINEINTNISNLTGDLKEEKAIDDGNGNIIYVEEYKTYDKTGEQYATSLEEVNEKINNLLNTVSVAKDVQDGAQENLIEYITHKDQTFNINGENVVNHFITAEKPENSKTVILGINEELFGSLKNDIINKSYNKSKEYIDHKLNWKVN